MTPADAVDDAARADLDTLLAASLRLAQEKLAEASEFEPFALVIDLEGRLLAVDLDTSALGNHPETDELVDAIEAQLVHLAASTRCISLTLLARIAQPRSDAIEVRLEHHEGGAVLALQPYKRPRFGGRIEYGEIRAFPGQRAVWPLS